jgi:hypothetical protein
MAGKGHDRDGSNFELIAAAALGRLPACQLLCCCCVQEFGKTKIYIPKQEGLEVLSKEVR